MHVLQIFSDASVAHVKQLLTDAETSQLPAGVARDNARCRSSFVESWFARGMMWWSTRATYRRVLVSFNQLLTL
jgi:hypothetical protein